MAITQNNVTKKGFLPKLEPKSVGVKAPKRPQQPDVVLPQIHGSQQKTHQRGGVLPQVRAQKGHSFTVESFASKKKLKIEKEKSCNGQEAMSPAYVLKAYKKYLTEFEQEEIKDYEQVWYLGRKAKKIQGSYNSQYDDEEGFYRTVIKDHIAYRYEVLAVISEGGFGHVLKCRDHKTMELVALKVVRNLDRCNLEGTAEVKILDALRKKDENNAANILHMKDNFYFRSHLCISFELLGKDLYKTLEANNFQGFSIPQVRQFAIDLLNCLQLLQKERIIHCDLKPENILLSDKDQEHVKVIDFGASCFEENRASACIQTLLYMSPEVLLGKDYSMAIDMWSLGCILAELHTGSPLFAGLDMYDQFNCIMEVLGVPPAEFVRTAPKKERKKLFDSKGVPKNTMNFNGKIRVPNSRNLASLLKTKDANFLDFIQRCLKYNPEERMTPDEAMQHPWIRKQLLYKRVQMPAVRLQPVEEKEAEVTLKSSTAGKGKIPVQSRFTLHKSVG
ncbi:dual specificity tyrosine-phosphorylation-regulated kinase 4-like [Centroberyx affinis]|uniref:dual specificity tyrosine-phosphorylation-regulated kinase 4-like n=1 Tax=Centroberyx affinis TaxID=166261 RepID=UPI003A5B9A81